MKHGWAALAVVLALGALVPKRAVAQQDTSQSQKVKARPTAPRQATEKPVETPKQGAPRTPERSAKFELGRNYPNPFNPSTTIPFTLGDYPQCTDAGKEYRVTLRIFNVLAQEVAVPILQGQGVPLRGLTLRCGTFAAYWNGKYRNSDQSVASGVYVYTLEVNGRAQVKKMLVVK
jgi:hypothetical protein